MTIFLQNGADFLRFSKIDMIWENELSLMLLPAMKSHKVGAYPWFPWC